jgi:hypothetical protein
VNPASSTGPKKKSSMETYNVLAVDIPGVTLTDITKLCLSLNGGDYVFLSSGNSNPIRTNKFSIFFSPSSDPNKQNVTYKSSPYKEMYKHGLEIKYSIKVLNTLCDYQATVRIEKIKIEAEVK